MATDGDRKIKRRAESFRCRLSFFFSFFASFPFPSSPFVDEQVKVAGTQNAEVLNIQHLSDVKTPLVVPFSNFAATVESFFFPALHVEKAKENRKH